MNGNYLFNQIISRQRVQERLKEAEVHRLAKEARNNTAAGRVTGSRPRLWRRLFSLPHIEFKWHRPRSNRYGGVR
ncbi:MAG TPA: hypothetical protein VF434_11215 [Promineifilum sp.]